MLPSERMDVLAKIGNQIQEAFFRPGNRPPLQRWIEHMADYQLHYFPESGNSYKLALMLTLCGQAFEPIWTDFGGGVTSM